MPTTLGPAAAPLASPGFSLRSPAHPPLLLRRSTGDPKYMFVVLNRISSENVVESVTTEFQMELTEQFLLYRNDTQEINGIWFYSSTERSAISELLQSIVAGAQPAAMAAPSEAPRPAPSAADVPAPGDSVANFFAAAAGGGTMPPMPQVPASAGESAAAAPPPKAPKQPKAAAKPEPPPPAAASDTAALKAQLRAKLSALINDDTFMDVLVQEYQQQQAAGGGAAAAANGGAAAAAAPAEGEVPAHLQALFKQMQT